MLSNNQIGKDDMPNWCTNTLVVKGKKSRVKEFSDRVKTNEADLSLDSLVPMDKSLLDSDAWYAWRNEHWGTKWDVQAGLIESSAGYRAYGFASAWAPPIAWLEQVAPQWPDLSFTLTYDEPGWGFRGVVVGEQGEAMVLEEEDYFEDEER